MRIFIVGADGFIGSSLVEAILERTDWHVVGLDLRHDRLGALSSPRLRTIRGDALTDTDTVDREIDACDVVIPLAAIATPASYVRRPLDVFELTFEANLRIVKRWAASGKRLIFPSSSEVYGMSAEPVFDEDRSSLVVGPTCRSRWIYSCSKQLLERVIHAHAQTSGSAFTVIRPFNWIGAHMDPAAVDGEGVRVVAQFIDDLAAGRSLRLVDGGRQRRCFTHVDDGIDCLLEILRNPDRANGQVFNIGHPGNECSVRELATKLRDLFREVEPTAADAAELVDVPSDEFYGAGYEDVAARIPSVRKARELLDWEPRIGLDEALEKTLRPRLEQTAAGCR